MMPVGAARLSRLQNVQRACSRTHKSSIAQALALRWLSLPPSSDPTANKNHSISRTYLKAHEKDAATLALRYYLANHKGISLQDATHISDGAPCFIRKLLASAIADSYFGRQPLASIRLHVEAYLEKEGIDEYEPFLESIGLKQPDVEDLLPQLRRACDDQHEPIKGAKVLDDAGVCWKKVGKVFKRETQILLLAAEELRARIRGLERLGFEKKGLAVLIQGYPSVLRVKASIGLGPVMVQLEKLGLKQQIISYLLSTPSRNGVEFCKSNLQKVLENLQRCKLTKTQISEIVGLWPQIVLRMSADELSCRIDTLIGLKLSEGAVGRIIYKYPEILSAGNKSCPSFKIQILKGIGFQAEEIGRLVLRDPHIFQNLTESSFQSKITYFETLGMEKGDLRKVIASFPAVTGCSLQQNLQAKIQFFESIGLGRESIKNIVLKAPSILALSLEQNLKLKIEFLQSIGVSKDDLVKVITKFPAILYLSVEKNLKPKVLYLRSVGFDDRLMAKLILQRPSILGRSVVGNLTGKVNFLLEQGFLMGSAPLAKALGYLFSMNQETLETRLHELELLGLTKQEVRKIVRQSPGVLYLSKKQLESKVQYLTEAINVPVTQLVKYPVFLDYSLEKRIMPRHKLILSLKERGVKLKQNSFWTWISFSEQMFRNVVSKISGAENIFDKENEAHASN